MKSNSLIYGLLAASVLFAGVMGYLFFANPKGGDSREVFSLSMADRGKTVSGKEGKALIAYSGDTNGYLEPCG